MSRSTFFAIGVFLGVILIGVIDIASYLRVEALQADVDRRLAIIHWRHSEELAALEQRVTLAEIHLATVEGLARETYGSLKKHKGHAVPRPERPQPAPMFR